MDGEPKGEIWSLEPSEIIRPELLPDAQFDTGQLSDDKIWLQTDRIKEAIESLQELTDRWDGSHSKRVDRLAMAKLLDTLTTLGIPAELWVDLVPHSSGGVQAEWHHGEQGLEISVNTDGSMDALAWPSEDGGYSIEIESVSSFSEAAVQALRKVLSHFYELSQQKRKR